MQKQMMFMRRWGFSAVFNYFKRKCLGKKKKQLRMKINMIRMKDNYCTRFYRKIKSFNVGW